jgi:hypothetical protein
MKLRISQLLSVMLLFALLLPVQSKEFDKEQIRKNLPKMLGANNQGREFYFSFIPCWESTGSYNNDLKIYVSSGVKTQVKVQVPGKGYEKIKSTIPNDIIEFTLAPAIGQCYTKTDRDAPEEDQVWSGAGVRVVADDPIICYGVTRYQYTSDGFLAIPVPALGKEYIISSYADPASNTIQWLSAYSSITAPYDKTKVVFTMGGNEWSKTAGLLMPGQSKSWTLNQGDVLLIAGLGQHADISGSTVIATKPVAVVSGNFCAYIPTNCGCCDVIEEMELPMSTWGTEYHVTRIHGRVKHSFIKVYSKEAKTKIFRDYEQIAFIRTSGGVEGQGHIHMRADEGFPRPVVISGDKPISVTQYNQGQLDDNIESDPFQLVLTPTEQYQREIIFNTPGIRGGAGFQSNYLNICYEATAQGTIPKDLAFAQVEAGDFVWIPMRDLSPNPGFPFEKEVDGKNYYSKSLTLPGDGVYKIKGSKPFTAYAYGFSWCDSYGFPTSVALGDLTKVDTLPPEPEWMIDCFGKVNFDKARYVVDKPDDPENRSNLSTIYMHSDKSYNFKLYHEDFMPCDDPFTAWSMEVVDNSEDAYAVVTFADCAGNDTTIFIEFNAVKLTIVPKERDYGLHSVGQSSQKMFWVVNLSETSPAELWYLKLKYKDDEKDPQGFTIWDSTGSHQLPTEFTPPVVIQPLDSMPFIVKFDATEEGEFDDSIGIGDTCVFWYKSYVRAQVGAPIIDVSDCAFPPTMVGGHAYGSFEVQNIGSVSLDIYDYEGPFITGAVSNDKIYKSSDLEDINLTDPSVTMSLKPGEVKTFNIVFYPDDELDYPDSIVFISNTIKDESLNNGNPIDSVCLLNGTGIRSDLQATSYNWERKRIHRPGTFDIPPYPAVINATNPDTCIRIYNGATASVTIQKLNNTVETGDISAFDFDRAALLTTLDPGEELIVPVTFQPTQTGPHMLTFEYETNPPIQGVNTTLQGTGIVPRIATSDVDFGSTIKDDFDNYVTRPVTFTNLSSADWQYGDSVTITDFSEVNINPEIINDWDTYPEPFRYDKDPVALPFPIVLQPGESLTFYGDFVAKSGDPATGSLTTVCDAEANVTSNWTGDGELQSADMTGDSTTICTGMIDVLDVTITNTNETDLQVGSVTIDSPNPTMFAFVDPNDANGFSLPSYESRVIQIRFTPGNQEGTYMADIVATTNALNDDSVKTATVTGQAVHYERDIQIVPQTNADPIKIDRYLEKTIELLPGNDLEYSQITGFIVNIDFNGDFLLVEPWASQYPGDDDGIILGDVFDDYPPDAFTYEILGYEIDNGMLSLEIKKNPAFDGYFSSPNGGSLLTITMGTYLPKRDSSSRFSDFDVSVEPVEEDGRCIDIAPADGSILLDSTCVFDIRKIVFNDLQFNLSAIKPNPVTGNEVTIEFDIGIDDCQTKIEIYNSANQLVAVPVNKVMNSGRYEVVVPVGSWASGSYYYIMKAGSYEEQKRMVIVK